MVDENFKILKRNFGDLTMQLVKKFKLLGMNITIMEDRKTEVEMKYRIDEVLDFFGE